MTRYRSGVDCAASPEIHLSVGVQRTREPYPESEACLYN
jgi:hypothetical protein